MEGRNRLISKTRISEHKSFEEIVGLFKKHTNGERFEIWCGAAEPAWNKHVESEGKIDYTILIRELHSGTKVMQIRRHYEL
jgi:hypothetical protein